MRADATRMLRFVAAGLVNTGFGYACYAAFVLAGTPLWIAVTGTTAIALPFNFASYGRFVFSNTHLRRLPRFLLFYASLAAANYALLRLAARFGTGPLLAQGASLPLLAGMGYFGMKYLVFFANAEGNPP